MADSPHTWERLTRAEATNFIITAMIIEGLDKGNRLVIDGDPGRVLETVADESDADKEASISVSTVITFARHIGHNGDTLSGLVKHLRAMPVDPVGT